MTLTVQTHSAPAALISLGELSLHTAVQQGCYAEAADLIAAGADLDRQDTSGKTPLHLAVRQGDTAMTALLLMSGADAAMETPDGVAPRTIARLAGGGLLLRLIETALRQQTISDIYGLTTGGSLGTGQSNHSLMLRTTNSAQSEELKTPR